MECDGLDSRSVHGGSGKKPGLGLDVESLSPKPRVRKMNGEEKRSGSKKRSKPIEVGFDSDDDEPIGALLKLKSKRNPKKVKVGLDGGGADKVKEVEVGIIKFPVEDEVLGGMEDTLASFRKKLKGPKKDGGSGTKAGKGLSVNVAEPSGQCLNGFDTSIDSKLESSDKGKTKRPGISLKLRKNGDTKSEHALGGQRYGDNCIENHSLDHNVDDSLSAYIQKAQSGLIMKSRNALRSKQRKKTQISNDEQSSNPDDIADDALPVGRKRSSSASVRAQKVVKSEDNLHHHSSRIPVHSVHDQNKNDSLSQVCDGNSEAAAEDSVPISTFQRSCSHLIACSSKTLQDGEVNRQTTGIQEGHTVDLACSDHLSIAEVKDTIYVPIPESISEIRNLTCESETRLKGTASDLVLDVVEMPNSTPAPEQLVELARQREDLLMANGKVSASHGKEIDGPSLDDLLNKPCEDMSPEILTQVPRKKMGLSTKPTSQNSSPCEKMELASQLGDIPDLDRCPKGLSKKEGSYRDGGGANRTCGTCIQEPDLASVSSKQDKVSASDGRLLPLTPCEVRKSEYAIQIKHEMKSLETDDKRNHHPQEPWLNEGNIASSVSFTPERNESFSQDNKQSQVQRPLRKPKKWRHGDMAYEGDFDWEILIHDQGFLERYQVEETREKFNPSSDMAEEAENGGAAAVSAGLKAREAGPVEKIKFKEVLKRKGGLQEYLDCRNRILGLWSKDVTRILPITDCGVTATLSVHEPPRASLVREIYAFLDQSGYINVGIASEREKADPIAAHTLKLLKEQNFGEVSTGPVADSDDGLFSVHSQARSSEASLEVKNGMIFDDENGYPENCCTEAKAPNRIWISDPSSEVSNGGTVSVHRTQSDSEVGKRIIVIGAGPAGLAASRHLQRQGFSVTVLEARSRIGGRVYTDRSSLSVPVDLGASIITGVEADVATERRPDPSSLVCAQLGLELTVLNSDCPLYDIVSGQKVPIDLDEALEAEYNSLLDDMVLLVAQKGEQAMRMSLEDGLEYALQRRRMARLGRNFEESTLHKLEEKFSDGIFSDKCSLKDEILSPLERRVMDWHFAHLEYGCAALLKEVSLPYWNQDDVYGGFGGAHCMIKGGYSSVVESLAEGLCVQLNHVVTNISYHTKDECDKVKVSTSNGNKFSGDAVLVTVPLGCLKAKKIEFSPPLPEWKQLSIERLGFGVLNKIVMEFPDVFWNDSVDYFGATAEETNRRGHCFMFWNVKKTVGAPVLIALVVGKAAIDDQNMSPSDHVNHAVMVLRKLFGESVPDPVASVVTDWGKDPFSYGAYSYVAIGASGEDYDMLGRPVENCLFFAGEATCKEHPDTVGGAMMSGLREAVRIIDILNTGNDYTAEVEAMEATQRHSDSERNELRDILKRLEAVELSNVMYKNSLDGAQILTKEGLLEDMFFNAKTTAGRLQVAKELLNLPVEALKSFAGTKGGLVTLNSWILDSMGKDGTQLLRHCVRLLVLVSTDLLAVRLSGIGKTVKEKVCVHTSRDIRAIASQLVSVWIEVFRREKASNGRLKLLRQSIPVDSSKSKSNFTSGKAPLCPIYGASVKKVIVKDVKLETGAEPQPEDLKLGMSEEEYAALAAAEAARAAALAAAEAYASSEAKTNTLLQLPKIPSFHKFARREQYALLDESDFRRKWPGGALGKQDCISEIDSRNCRVRDWSLDFSAAAACTNLDSSKMSVDNLSQRSHSNIREHSGESVAIDSSILTKAWVDASGSVGIKDYSAIERWQSQAAAAADSDFFDRMEYVRDEEDSNMSSELQTRKLEGVANESSVSQITVNKEFVGNQPRGADHIKQAVVDYVASLLMPLYKAKKIDKEGYKSIMKKTATKVMEQTSDAEKAMAVFEFLDFKRKSKIRAFVDKLIERHMAMKPVAKPS